MEIAVVVVTICSGIVSSSAIALLHCVPDSNCMSVIQIFCFTILKCRQTLTEAAMGTILTETHTAYYSAINNDLKKLGMLSGSALHTPQSSSQSL
jgi:uncharacterized MnhB-related membrane protein